MAALLVQFLVAIGNIMGRNVYRLADGARHYPNLFAMIVGLTSRGRKGSAPAQVLRPLRLVDREWAAARIQSGLSSGEGAIWAVRDLIERQEPVKEKGKYTGEHQTYTVDEGVADNVCWSLNRKSHPR